MTLTAAEPEQTELGQAELSQTELGLQGPAATTAREMVSAAGLDALSTLVNRSMANLFGGDDFLLRRIVAQSIEAFVDHDGRTKSAASQVAPLLWELGGRHAREGRDADSLATLFQQAQAAVQRGLQFAVFSSVAPAVITALRSNVASYLQHLQRHAWIGWERARVMEALQGDVGRDFSRERIGSALLDRTDPVAVKELAKTSGVDLTATYVLVVSAYVELPASVLDHPKTLTTDSLFEVLIPAGWDPEDLRLLLSGQVVLGPSKPLGEVAESAAITRQGANLLRRGLAFDERSVVPCTDLLTPLVIEGNPGLTNLLVRKHLDRMESMTLRRRITTGEILLHWLERGVPVNQAARDLGIPGQTAHSRMRTARKLFGDSLDDPSCRLELTVALQAALPRWRNAKSPRP